MPLVKLKDGSEVWFWRARNFSDVLYEWKTFVLLLPANIRKWVRDWGRGRCAHEFRYRERNSFRVFRVGCCLKCGKLDKGD